MTTYAQRSELEQKALTLATKLSMWQGIENTCLVALGVIALGLLISAYFGV